VTSSESGYSVVVMPVVSGEGENANYWFSVTNDPQTLDLNEIVLRSLNRAYSSLDGKSMSFKGLPVVFDSLEWAELLGFCWIPSVARTWRGRRVAFLERWGNESYRSISA